jgi:hypothetical protein
MRPGPRTHSPQSQSGETEQHHRPGRRLRYGSGRAYAGDDGDSQGQVGACIAHVRQDCAIAAIRQAGACIAYVRSASDEAAWRDGRRTWSDGRRAKVTSLAGQVQRRRRWRPSIPW